MPVAWRIERDLAWLESDEFASLREWRDAIDSVLSNVAYRSGMGLLHDRRRLATIPVTAEVAATIDYVSRRAGVVGDARWAVVIGSTGDRLGRVAELLIERTSAGLRLFQDMGEAEAWVRGGSHN